MNFGGTYIHYSLIINKDYLEASPKGILSLITIIDRVDSGMEAFLVVNAVTIVHEFCHDFCYYLYKIKERLSKQLLDQQHAHGKDIIDVENKIYEEIDPINPMPQPKMDTENSVTYHEISFICHSLVIIITKLISVLILNTQ